MGLGFGERNEGLEGCGEGGWVGGVEGFGCVWIGVCLFFICDGIQN